MNTQLLLHACCAPCSLEPVRLLREEGFEPVICWTNANIQPALERQRRFEELSAWCEHEQLELIGAPEDEAAWEAYVGRIGSKHRETRCRVCYHLRLEEACRVAAERGFSYVGTTLAVSPYQLFDICNEELERLTARYHLKPLIRDWRAWYAEATITSRKLGMYRQHYCGCRFSAAEAVLERIQGRAQRAQNTQ
ncbi:epoxyqueuosine reductase QueH [Collinsella sp. zg1085]|uniref:epoxyqueuosine reductase QueH n=1 Tax=Collinsella sp. zg1085 TaxID=2844380 RepID=UPI001C0E25C5|nr:epoxyqueuosine reductase QueH [Collinsella sp. zg1085]QWT17254.1 epoxyqueuosine reductase QueH [Collinsella sp. zg1085]